MKLYVENPDFIGEQVCGSHERNIMIDQYGDVQLCFSMRGLMNGNALGNVRQTTLSELWTSNLAAEARGIMSNCRQNCGMLNCHRKQVA
jgi:MoaA/NifB/PqqE/SkfB family radical SAM enzyme